MGGYYPAGRFLIKNTRSPRDNPVGCARRPGASTWAGSETSDYWVGYMDGAVRSGERAAAEVPAEL